MICEGPGSAVSLRHNTSLYQGIKMVTFEDFAKLQIRIGTVVSCSKVEGADKLLRLQVDLGDETRQTIAGMAEFFAVDQLVGKQIPILTNLEPRKFKGLESQGMIIAADVGGRPILLHPEGNIPAGSIVK
jgi:methionine--tRNA ligase beta chain